MGDTARGGEPVILPGTGRWHAAGVTEGGLCEGLAQSHAPSTILRTVPLPVPGRI